MRRIDSTKKNYFSNFFAKKWASWSRNRTDRRRPNFSERSQISLTRHILIWIAKTAPVTRGVGLFAKKYFHIWIYWVNFFIFSVILIKFGEKVLFTVLIHWFKFGDDDLIRAPNILKRVYNFETLITFNLSNRWSSYLQSVLFILSTNVWWKLNGFKMKI